MATLRPVTTELPHWVLCNEIHVNAASVVDWRRNAIVTLPAWGGYSTRTGVRRDLNDSRLIYLRAFAS